MPTTEAKSQLPLVLVSAVALVDIDGRILLAQRPAHKSMGGLWEFPGGKIEAAKVRKRP
jgi:8-oxo-dGTP diphosphatase